jgi:DNA-binding CsgD family transcriptional regulator
MDVKRLTLRERQIVELIGQGVRGRAVAKQLGITYFTLRKHRLNILRKHGLTTAAQLSAAAAAMLETASMPDRDFRPAGAPSPPGRSTSPPSSSRGTAARRSAVCSPSAR